MLKLNKKTGFALLAFRYMHRLDESGLASAREIAAWYSIPEMLLAKVLQVMKRAALVNSSKGSGGGYGLARPLNEMALCEVLELFNEQVQLVDCLGDDHAGCQQEKHCDIRGPLEVLNQAIMEPLRQMTVADLFVREGDRDYERERPQRLSIFR